ncbi:helix-turn-helix domain-containing protein [Clostridium weizhouense]|uniref:Helix-turn-helix domain-containing protein n=1 Tax=Clostridium weizhouense TaxID=2859781 RepID=A0ABS7AQZ8_9CLOT|nr:helix-turn-helix transcriptional regulator [Clostridium weizhouense]MBW6411074.1 helix-turn-helix domain-containing protein [Clostridium weizhouense]
MSRVGEKIKQAREKNGISAKVLAKKLGVAEKYINDIELGRKVANESFIERVAKFLKTDLNDISMVVTDEELMKEKKSIKELPNKKIEKSEVWTDAFASVIKSVPIYDYSLSNKKGSKELPIYSNKVEGYPQDKVFYLEIEDDEMTGFRMLKGDLAFAHIVKELSNNGLFLIEYKGKRKIRQIKSLGNSKVLLVSNSGSLFTETMESKEISVIAKLERIEIKL